MNAQRKRVLIAGAGTAGRSLAASIDDADVVGFLDDFVTADDVIGTLAQAAEVIEARGIELLYFAIPSVDAQTLRALVNSVTSDHLEIALIPRTYQTLAKEGVGIDDLTDVDILDLVGRRPVKHDLLESRAFIEGERILVTGAAGSIGSNLVRQIVTMQPERLMCIDWWENGMFFLGQEVGADPRVELRIADVKNDARLRMLFDEFRPTVVFHAAAYKHVPMMQNNPVEAINNNVGGSVNVMQHAVRVGAKAVVYVSTDKAVNPVNVMGATKRIGEIAMSAISDASLETSLTAVRFGNVIESNGSVMQIFRDQLAKKQPLTVTHPEVTRFFMTLDEAAQLVIQSAFMGSSGDIFVLDMGEPVKIMDLATSLERLFAPGAGIQIIGMRPGEKMYEELSYEPDMIRRTRNDKIFRVTDALVPDPGAFMASLETFLAASKANELSTQEAIDGLRALGFAIQ